MTNKELVSNFYIKETHKAWSKKIISDLAHCQIIKLLCSSDAEVIKLGAKKLKEHAWQ